MLADWLIPRWPAPPNVRAVCTSRAGGRSSGPYDSMNLGDHVGDHVLNVGANRAILHNAIQANMVFMAQVHGTQAVLLDGHGHHGLRGDAALSRTPGVACTMLVADCLPVLFTNEEGTLVAAAHAGWRGLAGQGGTGVLETTVRQFLTQALPDGRQRAANLMAWLGPCIGPQQFEVGEDVYQAFVAAQPAAAGLFKAKASAKWLADLQGLARQRLAKLGVNAIYGNDGSAAWCTVSNPSRFFSHRRDRGVSGRMAACIWLK
jgi:YfiH family protein